MSPAGCVVRASDGMGVSRRLPRRYNHGMKQAYPPDVLQFVQGSLESGKYASEDDVLVAGVRALREVTQRRQSLRDDIEAALVEIDAGQGEPWDVDRIKAELLAQLDADKAER